MNLLIKKHMNKVLISDGATIKVYLCDLVKNKNIIIKDGIIINTVTRKKTPIIFKKNAIEVDEARIKPIATHRIEGFKGMVSVGDRIYKGTVSIDGDGFRFLREDVSVLMGHGVELGCTCNAQDLPPITKNLINFELEQWQAIKVADAAEKEANSAEIKNIIYSAFCASKSVLSKHNLSFQEAPLCFSKSKAGQVKHIAMRGYKPIDSYMHEWIHPVKGGDALGLHVGYFKCPHDLIQWLFSECEYDRKTKTIYTKKPSIVIGTSGRTIKELQSLVGFIINVKKS